MNNYYIIDYPQADKIEELEAVIVGTIDQQLVLKNGQIVVKTPIGVKETPSILNAYPKLNVTQADTKIQEIENE